jgi:hemerythrin superfamily protein
MDALDVLKSDHEKVRSLYEQIKAGSESGMRSGLMAQLRVELNTHARIEETVFYPAFKNYPEFRGILGDAYADHREIKNLLRQMDESSGLQGLDELMSKVESHVKEEENDLFPMVRKLMKRSEREVLGRHLIAAKSERSEAA